MERLPELASRRPAESAAGAIRRPFDVSRGVQVVVTIQSVATLSEIVATT